MARPVAQVVAQLPLLQAVPDAQVKPQAPQLKGLDITSTQLCAHCARPASQPALHAEFEQTVPAAQTVPHAPQLYASSTVATQVPLQSAKPGAQPCGFVVPQPTAARPSRVNPIESHADRRCGGEKRAVMNDISASPEVPFPRGNCHERKALRQR